MLYHDFRRVPRCAISQHQNLHCGLGFGLNLGFCVTHTCSQLWVWGSTTKNCACVWFSICCNELHHPCKHLKGSAVQSYDSECVQKCHYKSWLWDGTTTEDGFFCEELWEWLCSTSTDGWEAENTIFLGGREAWSVRLDAFGLDIFEFFKWNEKKSKFVLS